MLLTTPQRIGFSSVLIFFAIVEWMLRTFNRRTLGSDSVQEKSIEILYALKYVRLVYFSLPKGMLHGYVRELNFFYVVTKK